MTAPATIVPRNVLLFEALLYLSLALDSVSVPFRDDLVEGLDAKSIGAVMLIAAAMILAVLWLTWVAARQRKNWARWLLLVFFTLSMAQLMKSLQAAGLDTGDLIDLVSAALMGAGLYKAFTGDARGWFV